MYSTQEVSMCIKLNKSLKSKAVNCLNGFILWAKKGYAIVIISVVTILTAWLLGAHWNLLMPIVLLNVIFVVAEVLNTAIERICNIIDRKWNVEIGKVKDISSSAVWIVGLTLLVIWLWVVIDLLVRVNEN